MTYLGNQIKDLRIKMALSQKELADILQVSQTSIAHYEKGNRQPTIETLMALSTLFNVTIDQLVGAHGPQITEPTLPKIEKITQDYDHHINTLFMLLSNKQSQEFTAALVDLSAKIVLSDMIEHLITPIQRQIGLMWEQGKLSEADEHYATHLISKTMHRIYFSTTPLAAKKRAISMVTHGEQHTLGIELISEYLEKRGIKTLYLGQSIPTSTLNSLIKDYQPDYLILGITRQEHINGLIDLIHSVQSKNPSFEILVGGQASQYLSLEHFSKTNVTIIATMDQLINKLMITT